MWAETSNISEIGGLPVNGICLFGFLCIMLGAIGQSGLMPFHSWIPDASENTPTVFMAAFSGTQQVILGGYLALRATLDIYHFEPGTGLSTALMAIGAVTVVLASAMALVQNDIKRLISYCAISQAGFLFIGIGTGLGSGYSGALFSLINTVICISGLFMICGIIEKQVGTTDLRRINGLKMPAAAVCFTILSLSVAGFPGLSGFFSKEILLDAVYNSNIAFYICALLGTLLTALSLLKMGRSLFAKDQNTNPEKRNQEWAPDCSFRSICYPLFV